MKITFIKTCIISCTLILLGGNLISCRKSTNNQKSTVFSDDAKEWFTKTVVEEESDMLAKPYTELPKDDPSRVFARMGKLETLLNWIEAKSYISDKQELLIVPVKEKIRTLESKFVAKRCIVFYRGKNGEIEMNVIEGFIQDTSYDVSDPDFWKTSFLNYFYKENSRLENYNADICVYDKNYQFKAGFTVKNGVWKKSGVRANIEKTSNTENNFVENSQVATTANSDCQLWGVWLVYYDENGNEIDRTLLYTYCVYNEGFEDPSYGGGLGGPSCFANLEEAQNAALVIVNSGQNLYTINPGTAGLETIAASGTISKPVTPVWDFHKAIFPMGFTATYTAYFTGNIYKESGVNIWKWGALEYSSVNQSSGTVPPCISFSMVVNSCSVDRQLDNGTKADATINWTGQAKAACAFGWQLATKSGSITNHFYSQSY